MRGNGSAVGKLTYLTSHLHINSRSANYIRAGLRSNVLAIILNNTIGLIMKVNHLTSLGLSLILSTNDSNRPIPIRPTIWARLYINAISSRGARAIHKSTNYAN
jgi:hypothetical protein